MTKETYPEGTISLLEKQQRYRELMHAVQTGVKFCLQHGSTEAEPKHLRVGLNSCFIDNTALVRLLIAKGVFTEEEHLDAVIKEAEEEVKSYELLLKEKYGATVKLG